MRDPYILADAENEMYYLYNAASQRNGAGQNLGGVAVYKSKDLKMWEGPTQVFTVPEDNYVTGAVWAPEVHKYQGRYYLFATLNSGNVWKRKKDDWPAYTFRCTQIFHSDSPEGPFMPFERRLPHTPIDYMALDGTFWVEDGLPYMVFCHEWVQMPDGDGTMEVVQLTSDLSAPVGQPVRLFCGSAAPWSWVGTNSITDGCFLYRTKTDRLLMIWSGFSNEGYAIGIAESATGKIFGPWRQQTEPLFNSDGGHGSLFKTFDGKLCIVFHQPNSGREIRPHIYELEDTGETLTVKQEIN